MSRENESNTPDFILAEYIVLALETFELGIQRREKWYGQEEKLIQSIRDRVIYALYIMDEKGKHSENRASMIMFNDNWDALRRSLVHIQDSIDTIRNEEKK